MKKIINMIITVSLFSIAAVGTLTTVYAKENMSKTENDKIISLKQSELESIYSGFENKSGIVSNKKMSEYVCNVDLSDDIVISDLDSNTRKIYDIVNDGESSKSFDEIKEEIVENRIITNAENDMIEQRMNLLFEIINRTGKYSFQAPSADINQPNEKTDRFWIKVGNACCETLNSEVILTEKEKELIENYMVEQYYHWRDYHYPEIDNEVKELRTKIEGVVELPYGKTGLSDVQFPIAYYES